MGSTSILFNEIFYFFLNQTFTNSVISDVGHFTFVVLPFCVCNAFCLSVTYSFKLQLCYLFPDLYLSRHDQCLIKRF